MVDELRRVKEQMHGKWSEGKKWGGVYYDVRDHTALEGMQTEAWGVWYAACGLTSVSNHFIVCAITPHRVHHPPPRRVHYPPLIVCTIHPLVVSGSGALSKFLLLVSSRAA